jgi:hypothetical protein
MSRAVDQRSSFRSSFSISIAQWAGHHHVALKLTRFIPPAIINLFKARRLSKMIDISRINSFPRKRVWSNQSAIK